MRKELIISLIFIVAMIHSTRAQDLGYTQYYLNLPAINPGFTGIENFWDARMSFRQGVNNFNTKNNSLYASSYGTVNSGFKALRNNNSLRTSNPNSYNEIEYKKKTRKKLLRRHGVGGMLYNRAMDTYQSFNASLNYAYHLPISQNYSITLGTSFRYTNQQIGFENLTVRDDIHDLFYQQLVKSGQGQMDMVVMDFGSVLYSDKFYLGLSSSGLISQAIGGSDFNGFLLRSYSLQGSRFVRLGKDLELSPMLKLNFSSVNDLSGTVTARFRYKNLVYAGLGYNSIGKMSGMLGFTVDGKYNLNYSYDHHLTSLGNFNINVHEIVFGLSLFNKYSLSSKLW